MTENKRFTLAYEKGNWWAVRDGDITLWKEEVIHLLNVLNDENQKLKKENEQLKQQFKRCRDWLNSDKYDYELTLAFIKNKGYSLRDVLEYEKELKDD